MTANFLNVSNTLYRCWLGAMADIPDGWVLCDGNNGTPDLRDQFIDKTSTNIESETINEANQTPPYCTLFFIMRNPKHGEMT